MTKIVYNACYGGFGVSRKAFDRYWELKGQPAPEDYHYYCFDDQRDDPILAQVVEALGSEASDALRYLV